MNKILTDVQIFDELLYRYPELEECRKDIWATYETLVHTHSKGGKLLVAGNGGSACDSDHIVGELMKSFRLCRPIEKKCRESLEKMFGKEGEAIADSLEGALPAIAFPSISGLSTAFSNDRNSQMVFAQMVYGYGEVDDTFLGITTSGNSKNIINAFLVARAKGIKTIALTGRNGGQCLKYADIAICVPSDETFVVQEYHLPIYHALCAMEEARFFGYLGQYK